MLLIAVSRKTKLCKVAFFLQTEVKETADEINSRGGTAHAYKCDVTKSDDVKKTAAKVRDDVGDLYMVVSANQFYY